MSDSVIKRLLVVAFALMALLRFVDLRADNPTNIDFSFGQFTDETYYTMNARNQVLFGQARLDEFNNMDMSPLLHYVHLANFSVFGVGAVQARSVSAVFSRTFEERAAVYAMPMFVHNSLSLDDGTSRDTFLTGFGARVASVFARGSFGFGALPAATTRTFTTSTARSAFE